MVTYHLKHAAELWATGEYPGPTGDFVEVLRGEVQDAGGNVLFAGTADECVTEQASYRVFTQLVPTEWRAAPGEVSGADYHWQLVTPREEVECPRCRAKHVVSTEANRHTCDKCGTLFYIGE